MDDFDKNTTAAINLGDGWSALVSLAHGVSADDWRTCLSDPETLTDDPQRVIRGSGSTRVIVKNIQPSGGSKAVVIKNELAKNGLKAFFRSSLVTLSILPFIFNTVHRLYSVV